MSWTGRLTLVLGLHRRLRGRWLAIGAALVLALSIAAAAVHNRARNVAAATKQAAAAAHLSDPVWLAGEVKRLAGEVERLGGEITAVVPPEGPHPPAPHSLIGALLRNRVGAFELGTLEQGVLNPPPSERSSLVLWVRERDDPGAATYYTGVKLVQTPHDWRRKVHYAFLAVCTPPASGQPEPPCRAVLQPELFATVQAWVGVTFPRARLHDHPALLHRVAELVTARDAAGSPPWFAPGPGAWDGLDQVAEMPPEGTGALGPGEAADERDHPFSSAWLRTELTRRETQVLNAVRAPGERVGAPEGALWGYVRAELAGWPVAARNGLLEFAIRDPLFPSLVWYGSRSWLARGGTRVAYRFSVGCGFSDHAGQRLNTVCKASVYLEAPDMWLQMLVPSERREEIGTIVHYAAEAAVAADAEGRHMRGLHDKRP